MPRPFACRSSSLLLALLFWSQLGAASAMPDLAQHLVSKGYQDVAVLESDGTVTVAFTDQTHRRLSRALGDVLQTAAVSYPTATRFELLPQVDRIALGSVTVPGEEYRRWQAGEMSDREFASLLEVRRHPAQLSPRQAPSIGQLDLGLYPGYSLFGGLSLSLQEEWQMGLADGLRAEGLTQQTFLGPPLAAVRRANLCYANWLGNRLISSARLGYFSSGGWGGQLELGLPLSTMDLRLLTAWTEHAYPEAIARFRLQPGWLDLALTLGGGTYLDGDWGYEATMTRTFPRSTLSGTMLKTSLGFDLRAILVIALGGENRPPAAPLRIEAGNWPLVYQAEAYNTGRTLVPVSDLEAREQALYADEVRDAVPRWPRSSCEASR